MNQADLTELAAANRTVVQIDESRLVHNLIEEQARRTPDRVAAIFRDRSLTYRDLSERIAALAADLRARGIGPEQIVAVCLERSLEMLIALVAVLKAGAAYLPLDPAFPRERTSLMLADSGAVAVITQPSLADRFASRRLRDGFEIIDSFEVIDGFETIDVDDARRSPADILGSTATSANLAYLMYTSGSTGTPKGVMIEHRNLLNFLVGMNQVLGVESGVWLAVTSISFDISVLELLWTLTRGFTVIIQGDEDKLLNSGPYSLPQNLVRHGVSHLQCTPTLAAILARDPETLGHLKPLRKLLLGGEALPPVLADRLARSIDGDLLNMYGPTETTIWSSSAKVMPGAPISLGRPITNTQIYILDENRRLSATGAIGELYIGGAGVARGYWNRPELTADRFVSITLDSGPAERLYRTGDLARHRTDGVLEFLGRIDTQIKLRGYRIELGEIEAVLESHPAIQQAIVNPFQDRGTDQLAAYLIAQSDDRPDQDDLRSALRRQLPEHMVPAVFVFMDALPTTPNGKIDRRSLPHPVSESFPRSGKIRTQLSELEHKIAGILRDALGVDAIDPSQNFFDLGATSLTIAEAGANLAAILGREIKLTALFAHPTVSSLATFLEGHDEHADAAARGADRGAARRTARTRRGQAPQGAKNEL